MIFVCGVIVVCWFVLLLWFWLGEGGGRRVVLLGILVGFLVVWGMGERLKRNIIQQHNPHKSSGKKMKSNLTKIL